MGTSDAYTARRSLWQDAFFLAIVTA